ncbi:MAG: GGDEF domain-containing protein [Denitromonas halophila]|nr:MAG: GGDEF domain-containing protein [Denitromonas halophila]TVT71315.1 MAG: GGDEF domain-containing protein [Denitromonas halophila]
MPSLDIRTLILLLGLGNLLLFLTLVSFRFVRDDRNAGVSHLWMVSKLLQSAAWALLWARGSISGFWSIEVGNTLLLAGFGLETLAAWQFSRGRLPRWLIAVVVVVVAVRYPLNLLGGADPAHRVVVASLLSAGLFAMTGWALVWLRPERTRLQYFIGGSTLLLAAVVATRGVLAGWPGNGFALLDANVIQVATFLSLFLLMLTNGFGVVLLDTERVGHRLKTLATRDSLTGVSNRRDFLERLRVMVASASRNGYPFTLMALDLDHFKQVNDRFGHPGGDIALCRFAQLCEDTVRESDVVGRVGGEEFMVAMNGAGAEEALAVAERLRALVASTPVTLASRGELDLSVSVGLATLIAGDSVASLMTRADAALYRAKRNGRNRVDVDGQAPAPNGASWLEQASRFPDTV